MTARSIRRAIERKHRKQARKAAASQLAAAPIGTVDPDTTADPDIPSKASSRLDANRQDDPAFLSEAKTQRGPQSSTGPRTPEGKLRSSLNALKTGLTGRTVLMPHDDAEEYAGNIAAYELDYQPAGQHERDLVQSIADSMWRLKRVAALEFALLAKGQIEFRKGLPTGGREELPADLLSPIAELEAYLKYEKQLRNLHLQESRLHRRYTLQVAELQKLQTERRRREQSDLNLAAEVYEAAEANAAPFDPAEFGFEFSTPQIKRHIALRRARKTASASTAIPHFSVPEGSKFQSHAA